MPPDEPNTANCLQPGLEANEGGKHRRAHVPRDDARGLAWLSWRSHELEHGMKPHKVSPDGSIQEIGDRASRIAPKRKPKAISSRQWEAR